MSSFSPKKAKWALVGLIALLIKGCSYQSGQSRGNETSPKLAGAPVPETVAGQYFSLSADGKDYTRVEPLCFLSNGREVRPLKAAGTEECFINDRIAYIATNGEHGVIVTMETGGPAFMTFGDDGHIRSPVLHSGYVTESENGIVLDFFSADARAEVQVSNVGSTFGSGWALELPYAQRSEKPTSFFIANELFEGGFASLDPETRQLTNRLATCNHLAGEAGGDAARNADLAQKWSSSDCDSVPEAYDVAIKLHAESSILLAFLRRNAPNWQ